MPVNVLTPAARLSGTPGVAVTEADVDPVTQISYVSAGHNYVLLFDGTSWRPRQMTSEPTLVLNASTHLANKEFSVFACFDSNTVKIGTGPAWANSTTVGTGAGTSETEVFEGVRVNKFSITLTLTGGSTITIPARQARLIGGFATTSIAGQTADSKAKRLLSNEDNAVPRAMVRTEPTDTWVGGIADTWIKARASALNVLEVFQIGGGRATKADVVGIAVATDVGGTIAVGVGIDSDTPHVDCIKQRTVQQSAGFRLFCVSSWAGSLGIGRHQMRWLEAVGSVGGYTWSGDQGNNLFNQSGIRGEVIN